MLVERRIAAMVLSTFANTAVGSTFIHDAAIALRNEARTATDMQARADAMTVRQILLGKIQIKPEPSHE